jgi:hypothetical protein
MSNTTVIDSFLSAVNLIRKNTSLYGYSIMFVFGNIGSILNILILTHFEYFNTISGGRMEFIISLCFNLKRLLFQKRGQLSYFFIFNK